MEWASQKNTDLLNKDNSVFKIATDSYQSRMMLWTGKDPLECPHCGHNMEVIKVWSKEKGIIFDLLEEYKKKGHPPPDELQVLQKVIPTEPINIVEDGFKQMEMPLF